MTFSDNWKKAGEPADDFDPPNNHYIIRITDGGAFTGNDGREWAKLTLQIQDGEHKGKTFVDFMNLNNEVGLRIARENLALYGLKADQVEDIEDLDNGMLELVGTTANVTVTHSSGGYLNVKVASVTTGTSDVPDNQASFDTSDFKAKPVSVPERGPHTDPEDEEEIPF